MIPSLQKVHSFVEYPIHQPVLVSEPPGPDVRPKVFERLRLPNPFKGVSEDRVEQVEEPQREPATVLDEVSQIGAEVGSKDASRLRLLLSIKPELPAQLLHW